MLTLKKDQDIKDIGIMKLVYNELNNYLQINDDSKSKKILFVLDNAKNDEQKTELLNNLPKKIKVLLTTRNRDLLIDENDELKKMFLLSLLNQEQDYRIFKENF